MGECGETSPGLGVSGVIFRFRSSLLLSTKLPGGVINQSPLSSWWFLRVNYWVRSWVHLSLSLSLSLWCSPFSLSPLCLCMYVCKCIHECVCVPPHVLMAVC